MVKREYKYFTLKGTVEPYVAGTRIVTKQGFTGTIKQLCPCTAEFIHYEVNWDDKKLVGIAIIEHADIVSVSEQN